MKKDKFILIQAEFLMHSRSYRIIIFVNTKILVQFLIILYDLNILIQKNKKQKLIAIQTFILFFFFLVIDFHTPIKLKKKLSELIYPLIFFFKPMTSLTRVPYIGYRFIIQLLYTPYGASTLYFHSRSEWGNSNRPLPWMQTRVSRPSS